MNICKCGCQKHCNKEYCQGHYLKHYLKNNKHFNFKTGKIINKAGYVMIFNPNHPCVSKSTQYIMEHRLVMEKHLGRYLTDKEEVHHINGIKNDNRIENLHLYSSSDHTAHHNKIDMSNRVCLSCDSNKTTISKKGRPIWSKHKNGFLCVKCYRKWRYHNIIKKKPLLI